MAFTNSPLVTYKQLSPNYNTRTAKIDTITPHCVVGHLSLQTLARVFSTKEARASSNYGIDDDGNIGMFVEEKNRSWASSSPPNDHRAVTIEVASDKTSPYKVTNGAFDGLIKLAADICNRNGIAKLIWQANKSLAGNIAEQNITAHRWFAARACPGDYLYGRLGELATEVNRLLLPPITKPSSPSGNVSVPYRVKVNANLLFYRSGPGVNYPILGQKQKDEVLLIIEEANGRGSSKWGKVHNTKNWVDLDHCLKVG